MRKVTINRLNKFRKKDYTYTFRARHKDKEYNFSLEGGEVKEVREISPVHVEIKVEKDGQVWSYHAVKEKAPYQTGGKKWLSVPNSLRRVE